MQTLASILAGLPADPYQTSPGLAPLLMQNAMVRQFAGAPQQPQMPPGAAFTQQPQMPMGMMPGAAAIPNGLGSLAATALPNSVGY